MMFTRYFVFRCAFTIAYVLQYVNTFLKTFWKTLFSLLLCGVSFETMASIPYVLQYVNRDFEKNLRKWKAYFLHYIEVVLFETCGKIAKKYWFYGIFRRFWRAFMCWSVCGCIADCKSWKEKVFVLSDYIYTYMFHLCSWMFRAAAIEKNCIFLRYTRIAELETAAEKRIEKKICSVLLSKMCSVWMWKNCIISHSDGHAPFYI